MIVHTQTTEELKFRLRMEQSRSKSKTPYQLKWQHVTIHYNNIAKKLKRGYPMRKAIRSGTADQNGHVKKLTRRLAPVMALVDEIKQLKARVDAQQDGDFGKPFCDGRDFASCLEERGKN